jgi:hypothetical protein
MASRSLNVLKKNEKGLLTEYQQSFSFWKKSSGTGRCFTDWKTLSSFVVVRAVLVWSSRGSYGIKRLPKAAQLFMDGFVTLYRWILAAKTAPKHGRASSWTNYAISIPTTFRCSSASGLSYRACGFLQKLTWIVPTSIGTRSSNWFGPLSIEIPYQILPDRGTNVKKFSTR